MYELYLFEWTSIIYKTKKNNKNNVKLLICSHKLSYIYHVIFIHTSKINVTLEKCINKATHKENDMSNMSYELIKNYQLDNLSEIINQKGITKIYYYYFRKKRDNILKMIIYHWGWSMKPHSLVNFQKLAIYPRQAPQDCLFSFYEGSNDSVI